MKRMPALLAVALVACGSGGEADPPATPPPAVASDAPSSPEATMAGAGTPIEAPGIDRAVTLLAPATEGAGQVPVFEWGPVDGAAEYLLVVQGPEGTAAWAWEGTATRVALGGVEGRPVGELGPVLEPGSAWSVAALDAERHVIAVSDLRPVSP